MRLERLRLRNFKTFADVTVDRGPATVVVGANDSGKSAIVDALAWLFSGFDRHRRRPTFDTHVFDSKRVETESETHDLEKHPAFVVVAGEFTDLSDRERRAWEPVLSDGRLLLGRRLDAENDGAELHLVVTPRCFGTLIRTAQAALKVDPTAARGVLEDGGFEQLEDAFWLSLETLAELIFAGELPFWPKPWPNPYVDFPTSSDLVLIRGPQFGVDTPRELLRPLIARVVRTSLLGAGLGYGNDSNRQLESDRDLFTREMVETADDAISRISESYSRSLPRWVTASAVRSSTGLRPTRCPIGLSIS